MTRWEPDPANPTPTFGDRVRVGADGVEGVLRPPVGTTGSPDARWCDDPWHAAPGERAVVRKFDAVSVREGFPERLAPDSDSAASS